MRLSIEPRLMERVVWEAVRHAAPSLAAQFQRERTACYALPADQRDRAFDELHAAWFRRLGFLAALEDLLRSFPFLSAGVERAIVSAAAGPRAQAAELFGEDSRVLSINVHPSTLLSPDGLRHWAAHELTHVEDMLNPEFAYDRRLRPSGPNLASANLARERYATLWAISIDARLSAQIELPPHWVERRRREFARAFGLQCGADEAFDRFWARCRTTRPTHPVLIAAAQSGSPPEERVAPAESAPRSRQGTPCPVCGFSTFDWAELDASPDLARRVAAVAPHWSPQAGLCARCAEVYRTESRVPA